MGETRVDLLHLLEDLRDAYPGSLEETILTEIVANALDSGATTVAVTTDPTQASLTITDDGSGMSRRELRRYHDIAATNKTRGLGIGFAGVGIKLALLASDEVLTETRRRGAVPLATTWQLASRHRAPWRWTAPPGLVAVRGTAARLKLAHPLSPLLDAAFIEAGIRRHFQPLLDATFDELLRPHYPTGVHVLVNGVLLAPAAPGQRVRIAIRLARKHKPSAVGFLLRRDEPLPDEERGVAVSTLGKVIKRGWDWLGLAPAAADRVGGLIEAPALAECLTLNKADFIRTGPRGLVYLAYRKALQEAVSAQLSVWGEPVPPDAARRRATRPLERDLHTLLVDLAEQFPLLASLVERTGGGQRRLPIGRPGKHGATTTTLIGVSEPQSTAEPQPVTETEPAPPASVPAAAPPAPPVAIGPLPPQGRQGPRRPTRYGLAIRFESRPDDPALGRLVESTVWVNDAHPAYRRAAASRADSYHLALTVALTLAPLAVEPAGVHQFVTAFLARWGQSARDGRRHRGRSP